MAFGFESCTKTQAGMEERRRRRRGRREGEEEGEEEPAAVKTSTILRTLCRFLVQDLHVFLDLHEPFAFERAQTGLDRGLERDLGFDIGFEFRHHDLEAAHVLHFPGALDVLFDLVLVGERVGGSRERGPFEIKQLQG